MQPELEEYVKTGFKEIHGWVSPPLWTIMAIIDHEQRNLGVQGGVAEIGVHHGRFLLGLHALKSDQASALAIDIFDNQQLNIDGSGKGVYSIFQQNVHRYAVNPDDIKSEQADSLSLGLTEVSDFKQKYGKFSLFSVDGGHTIEHVIHDFNIAQNLTSSGGFIIVDDYQNQDWPGVHEGIAKLFFTGNPVFAPLICGHNKLILTDISHHAIYLDKLKNHFSKIECSSLKICQRFGWDCFTIQLRGNEPDFSYPKSLLFQS